MRNRLEISSAIPAFHKEPEIILQAVGSSGNREIQTVGVVILDHFTGPLLEVAGRQNAQVCVQRQANLFRVACGRLHHNREDGVAVVREKVGERNLALVSIAIFRYDASNSFVSTTVATGTFENWCDVFRDGGDSQGIG